MSTVHLPPRLRPLAAGAECVEAAGTTVGELIEDLERRFPGLQAALVEDGELSPRIAVSVDGVLGPAGLDEPVGEQSEVHFVPPLGGG